VTVGNKVGVIEGNNVGTDENNVDGFVVGK